MTVCVTVVADGIRGDMETYNDAILGYVVPSRVDRNSHWRRRASRDTYITTILKPSTWGGAIELGILAKHFNTEIASIDVETGRIDQFLPSAGGTGYRLACVPEILVLVSADDIWKMHCCVFWYPL